ncbi:NAD(P)/FAD-dependent oxidoreductase [Tabrizicola sp.]|uniref:NAD(P)/FAD-dependent oxidoreductase n=1 Tax=Tabrizicola sp. TaxID=2005166 RepID=UPI002FDDEE57
MHTGFDQPFDAAIVGGNFAGLQAALYLLRARRRVVLFDDGQHRNRFAAHSHSFLGHDGMEPAAIKANALAQLRAYPTLTVVEARVTSVEQGFRLDWDGGRAEARRLILATGQRDILPDLPGLAACWGITANQCPYCHGYELADLPTGVLLGDHPHAGQYLRQIRRWAGPLTVFDNGAVLAPETLELIATLGVDHVSGPVELFEHDAGKLGAVWVAGRPIPLRAFYLASRSVPASSFAADLGCEMADGPTGPFVKTDRHQRTSVPGIYAAGDLASGMPAAVFATASGATAGLGCDMDLAGLLPP